jgi:hypothetical protein
MRTQNTDGCRNEDLRQQLAQLRSQEDIIGSVSPCTTLGHKTLPRTKPHPTYQVYQNPTHLAACQPLVDALLVVGVPTARQQLEHLTPLKLTLAHNTPAGTAMCTCAAVNQLGQQSVSQLVHTPEQQRGTGVGYGKGRRLLQNLSTTNINRLASPQWRCPNSQSKQCLHALHCLEKGCCCCTT